ncbi:phage major capsid protein [Maricaulis sp.]|uniref:phage major capsid protein n=1 Tax=Maricaulis sp. TaxID=1486257 RepID=UPI001B169122|nr:phage major capsid protein [Maricaulis sp.]MBO6765769.1 phage major capsid protein [Maricaulis sp.]
MTKETKMTPVSAETRAALGEVLAAFEAFKEANDARLDELDAKASSDVLLDDKVARIDAALTQQKSALDRLLLDRARPGLDGAPANAGSAAWSDYMRRGDAAGLHEGKSASAGSDADGGYVVPAETEARIDRLLTEASPIRAIASVRQTSAGIFRKPVSKGGAATGWVAETAARPETDSPTLDLIDFPCAELYAMPAATQQLLDDAMVDIEQWLAEEVRDVFAVQEGAAFVNGNGSGKPRGFLNYTKAAEGTQAWGEMGYVATGTDGGFDAGDPADALIDLVYAPKTAYRARGRFVMNRQTVSAVRRFKDADGNYLWQPSLSEAGTSTLLGYPVTEAEDMPDIGSDAFAIAFGDFEKGYLVVDRQGVEVLRDPYSAKPYVLFYTTKRVGGGVQDFEAIKLLKFGTS